MKVHTPSPIAQKPTIRPISNVTFLSTLPRIALFDREFTNLLPNRFTNLPINQCVDLPPKVPIRQSGNVAQFALPIYQSINRTGNEGRTPPARYRRTVAPNYRPANRPID